MTFSFVLGDANLSQNPPSPNQKRSPTVLAKFPKLTLPKLLANWSASTISDPNNCILASSYFKKDVWVPFQTQTIHLFFKLLQERYLRKLYFDQKSGAAAVVNIACLSATAITFLNIAPLLFLYVVHAYVWKRYTKRKRNIFSSVGTTFNASKELRECWLQKIFSPSNLNSF